MAVCGGDALAVPCCAQEWWWAYGRYWYNERLSECRRLHHHRLLPYKNIEQYLA